MDGDPPAGDSGLRSLCQLCFTCRAQYRCPRCHVNYCSLSCYRSDKHVKCSEQFYKHAVLDHIKHDPAYAEVKVEEKRKMEEMLLRFEAQQLEQEEGEQECEEGAAVGWDSLTEAQQEEFTSLYRGDRLGSLLPAWTPWWETCGGEGSAVPGGAVEGRAVCAGAVTAHRVSPCVRYNLLNILYSYCYLCRLYLGAHVEQCVAAARDLCTLCDQLMPITPGTAAGGRNFSSAADAIHACLRRVESPTHPLHNPETFRVAVIRDVTRLLQGGTVADRAAVRLLQGGTAADHAAVVTTDEYVLAALSDLTRVFTSVRRRNKTKASTSTTTTAAVNQDPHRQQEVMSRDELQHVYRCIKKLQFLTEYVRHRDLFDSRELVVQLNALAADLESQLVSREADRKMVASCLNGRADDKGQSGKIVDITEAKT